MAELSNLSVLMAHWSGYAVAAHLQSSVAKQRAPRRQGLQNVACGCDIEYDVQEACSTHLHTACGTAAKALGASDPLAQVARLRPTLSRGGCPHEQSDMPPLS